MSNVKDPNISPFVYNLMDAFHVQNASLAIFLLFILCLTCALVLGLLIIFVFCYIRSISTKYKINDYSIRRGPPINVNGLYRHEPDSNLYGQLFYSLLYEYSDQLLVITVIRGEKLRQVMEDVGMDTYVTVKLASDKQGNFEEIDQVQKSDLETHTHSPNWNFTCSFHMRHEEWLYTVIVFEVFQIDSNKNSQSIGRLVVPLTEIDPTTHIENTVEHVNWLQPGESPYYGLGQISIGLGYQHVLERLECNIYEARNLVLQQEGESCQDKKVCAQVELVCEGRSLGIVETDEKSDLINPYFNKKAVYSLKRSQLASAKLICRLFLRAKRSKKQLVGSFVIGPNLGNLSGAKQWESMIRDSPSCVVVWHTVTPNLF